jgi:hypothetical protein
MYCVINKPNNYYTNVINQVNCKKIKNRDKIVVIMQFTLNPKYFFIIICLIKIYLHEMTSGQNL